MRDIVNVVIDSLHVERHVLCIKVRYDDLVLDLKCLFESLETDIGRGYTRNVYSARTFWSTFGKWSSLLAEDERVRTSGRDGSRRKVLSIFCDHVFSLATVMDAGGI